MPTKQELLQELLNSMKDPLAEETQNVTGIIYGDNGGGKTVTAMKLAQAIVDFHGRKNDPANPDIIFVDAVNAWRSLKNHSTILQGVKRIPYAGKEQLETIVEAIQWRPDGFKNAKVIILDEMSSMTDRDGDTVLAARAKADASKDPDVLTQPDMGATTERMRRVVINLLRQDISIIFVAHMREDEDKAKGYKVIRPRFMPKFSGTIREGLDFVAFMSAVEDGREGETIKYRRQLQVHPTRTIVAKTRVGGLNLTESPDSFVSGVIKWLKGDAGDSTVDTVIDDVVPNVSESDESDDFVGVSVSD